MAKTEPGPKELANRALAQATRDGKNERYHHYEGTDPVPAFNESRESYQKRVVAARKKAGAKKPKGTRRKKP